MLHPLPLPLSSCLDCIPPFIGLPFLRFYAVVSSLFLLFVFLICFCRSRRCPLLATFLSVRCVLHPLPLPLSSCLGCIPLFIVLPILRFHAVVSSLFLLFVFCIFLPIATMSFAGYFLVRSLLFAFPAYLRTFYRFDLVWVRLSCDHGWIRSGSVNVR